MVGLHAAASFLPVLLFLVILRSVDPYRLVNLRSLGAALVGGCGAAVLAYFANSGVREALSLTDLALSRYAGPLIEEILKGGVIGILLWRNRAGFLVDAAILGFGVGAGFAVVENLYLITTRDFDLATWIVRGFGTAIMHGGATTVFAILTKMMEERKGRVTWHGLLPALVAAFVIHSAYNHFVLPPLISTAVIALSVPVLVGVIFSRSEAATRAWITDGFDADQEVIRLLETGVLSDSRVGEYLSELKARFPGEVLVDMLCLVRLEAELSIRAKGMLMMREAGFDPKPDDAMKARIAETQYLEDSIGAVGRMALDPFLRVHGKESWQRGILGVS
ncbi:MAG: PrsW family intramembrane metalloprotease [Rhodothermales bacterium]|nr:PrsW family intramembrane metalloprotease [Rhodothermales bacterium]